MNRKDTFESDTFEPVNPNKVADSTIKTIELKTLKDSSVRQVIILSGFVIIASFPPTSPDQFGTH